MRNLEWLGSRASSGKSVVTELHAGHPGISRMKSLARGLVWWPGLDQEIENIVKQCSSCQ